MSTFDLADLVDEVGVTLQEQGEDRDPNLLRNWQNELGAECRVRADRDLLYRVLLNLARNAFEAGAATVTLRARRESDCVLVDVIDNGPGIPDAVRTQIFQPFTTGGRAGGAGLGLAISRDLVRAHGGDIMLADSDGKGTIFRFSLPL
jgi:signal transduction histidine kinase